MNEWRKDARKEAVITDIEALVPKDHLLRKVEKVMDYDWIYERLDPYYNHDVGRPGTDPVVLIKMVLIQHLFGIPSLRQTYQRIQDTLVPVVSGIRTAGKYTAFCHSELRLLQKISRRTDTGNI